MPGYGGEGPRGDYGNMDGFGNPDNNNSGPNSGPKYDKKQDPAEFLDDFFGPSPDLEKAQKVQEDKFNPDKNKGIFGTNPFKNLFSPPTAKEQFIKQVKYNPKLNRFIKDTYGIKSIDDITDEQVDAINSYNNLSYNEIKDALSNMSMSALTNPLGATYNAATLGTLGLTGVGMTGIANALANIAMGKPSYGMNPQNYAFTGPMVDAQGNLVSQDFSYTGPMSTNPAVNQQIADIQSISGVTGLTQAQMAEAAAKAISNSETGGNYSFGGDGGGQEVNQAQLQAQMDAQNAQAFMDSLSEAELYQYNQLIGQGYTDEYAKAYLGLA
jgi:hypothetical protein